jgi:hypothetical protein
MGGETGEEHAALARTTAHTYANLIMPMVAASSTNTAYRASVSIC